jgi:hypothetical protein
MLVSQERQGVLPATARLTCVPGGSTRSEARAWLAGRLRWEERLAQLERDARPEAIGDH